MTQIVEVKVTEPFLRQNLAPHAIVLPWSSLTIPAWLSEKYKTGIVRTSRIRNSFTYHVGSPPTEWNGSWFTIFSVKQSDDTALNVQVL